MNAVTLVGFAAHAAQPRPDDPMLLACEALVQRSTAASSSQNPVKRHCDATPTMLMQWAMKATQTRAMPSYYCCSDGDPPWQAETAMSEDLGCHGSSDTFSSLLAAVFEPMLRQAAAAPPSTAAVHTSSRKLDGQPPVSSDVDGGREDMAALRKLLHDCVRITPAAENASAASWLRVPITLVRLCLHPHAALRNWAMEEVLRLVDRPTSTRSAAATAQSTSSNGLPDLSMDTRVPPVWYVAAVFHVLVECLARYLATAAPVCINQQQSNAAAAAAAPSSHLASTNDAAVQRWAATLLTDGLLFVQALQRILKEVPPIGASPVDPSASAVPSAGSIDALPLVAGNLLVELLFMACKRCSVATSLDDHDGAAPPATTVAERALSIERSIAHFVLRPSLLQHHRCLLGGEGTQSSTDGVSATLHAQLAMTWIHCVLVDCRTVGSVLAGGSGTTTVLRHAWERLRWVWRVTSLMPPFQRRSATTTGGAGGGQPAGSASSGANAVVAGNLRDSVLKLAVGNLLKQYQIASLVTEGRALLAANAPARGVPASSSTATAHPMSDPAGTSAAGLGHWKQNASACALVFSTLIASYLHSDHHHHKYASSNGSIGVAALPSSSSLGPPPAPLLLPSSSVLESLAYHMVVLDQARSIASLLEVMHALGVSTPAASRESLLAPHVLLFQVVTVDLCSALRARHPSTIGNTAVWKLIPQLFRQALISKRDVESALKICFALMLTMTAHHHHNHNDDDAPSASVLDLHLLFLTPSVASTRAPVTTLLAECIQDINTILDTTDAIELVALYIAAVLRGSAAGAAVASSSCSGTLNACRVWRALCPMLSLSPTHDAGINLISGVGQTAWRFMFAADAKLRRLGDTLARKVFGHTAVVALAPAVELQQHSSTGGSAPSAAAFVARAFWQADAARFIWTLIASQPLIRDALPREYEPPNSTHRTAVEIEGINDDHSLQEDEIADVPLAVLYAKTSKADAARLSLPQCPTVGTRVPANVLPLARSQITTWLEMLTSITPSLLSAGRTQQSSRSVLMHLHNGAAEDAASSLALPWALNIVLEVMTGGNATSQQRRTFLTNGILRLYDGLNAPGALSLDEGTAGAQALAVTMRQRQRDVIGCATLFQLLSKASLFETTSLLSCIIAIGRGVNSENAAYLVGLTHGPSSKKQPQASAPSLFACTPTDMGLPTLKQWHVAVHGLWKQLPATDRTVLKATAHQSFSFFKALLDSMKAMVQDDERQRESAFAQFEREDAVEKSREDMQRQAEVMQAAALAENRRKDAQEREEVAARRRNAQDEEAARKRKREPLDDTEGSSWGIKELAVGTTAVGVGAEGSKPAPKGHRKEGPSAAAANEWAAIGPSGGQTRDVPVVITDNSADHHVIPAAYSLVHAPASANTIAAAAAEQKSAAGDPTPDPAHRVGNLKLMVASERRKALPLSSASKALLVKQLTDVVLQTEAPLGMLAAGTATQDVGRHRANGGSGGGDNVATGDIIGASPAALYPKLLPLPTEFDISKSTQDDPSSGGSALALDSTMASVVTWAHMKKYVDSFAPHLALELRHDVASSIRDFLSGWRRAATGGGRGGGKDYVQAAQAAGAFPVELRRGDAPRSPSSLRSNFTLQVGGEWNHQSVVQFLSDGDVVLMLLPETRKHHATTTAGGGGSSFDPAQHFYAVVAAVKEISFSDRTVSLTAAGYADATIRVLNAILSCPPAAAAPNTSGGGNSLVARRRVDFYVVRLGTQLSQYVTMGNALHDVLFTPARDTLLQPQLAAADASQQYLQAAKAAVAACEGGRQPTTPCAAATSLRHRLTASLNEFQRDAVHSALHGYFDDPSVPLARPSPAGGQFVIIQGPPGTGKTQTIHSIVAAVLREGPSYQRVLVCAPSNTAVDEVLLRLKRSGVAGRDGRRTMPTLLRVGIRDSVHPELLSAASDTPIFYDDVVAMLLKQLDAGGNGVEQQKVARQKAKDAALAQAQVVCVTLGSLRQLQQRGASFDFVIVDEASQATEPQCLLALTMGCKRCVLVGDTKQLQPTILAPQAARAGFGRSLMARLLIASHASVQLRVQYRMVPAISLFPNTEFYGGTLVDASIVREVPRSTPSALSIPLAASKLPRLLFVDVKRSEMKTSFPSKTLCNPTEAHVLLEQMRHLRSVLGLSVSEYGQRACIITYYKGQQSTLRRLLNDEENRAITVDTVDGFQGKEKDIVFVSCVRGPRQQPNMDNEDDNAWSIRNKGVGGVDAADVSRLGFVADPNRMNVSLTRAKDFLIVVGHAATLMSAKGPWSRFVSYASQEGEFTTFQTGVDLARGVDLGTNVFATFM